MNGENAQGDFRRWYQSGLPWIWLSAAAVSASLIVVIGLLAMIAVRGLGYFWPSQLVEFQYEEHPGQRWHLIGEIHDRERVSAKRLREAGVPLPSNEAYTLRYTLKVGNRDVLGSDFKLIIKDFVHDLRTPSDLMAVERREWGNFYGRLVVLKEDGRVVAEGPAAHQALAARLGRAWVLFARIHHMERHDIGAVNYHLEQLRLKERGLQLKGELDPAQQQAIARERAALDARYEQMQGGLTQLYTQINRDSLVAESADGQRVEIPLAKVVRVYWPNAMSWPAKLEYYFSKVWEFVSDDPREANTEGGVFPAIFGTVMMVMIMSVIVTPFGIIAAIYLREYARQGLFTRAVRIAVNNLAGVPSIVYGVFGLGFFVYFLGGNVDRLFFPEALPNPTFGTPGILWASLTLALLTLPVVIVATEEGLSRIPRTFREGSLALGATKVETIWRIILPMASPALMTGLILAVARAAGEVAPLMLVGVVKLAPSMPVDGYPPFIHLDRKFMHLGFHIYDVAFQSPNVEAARPLVYATALLLVSVIILLNLSAITIRNHLREQYRAMED